MSAHNPCTCGRRRGDLSDMAVTALKGNASAFNGYHWTRSDWSAVSCLRPKCTGAWRTKSDRVYSLPDCTGRPDKYDRLKAEVANRDAFLQHTAEMVAGALGLPPVPFAAPYTSSRLALLEAHQAQEPTP